MVNAEIEKIIFKKCPVCNKGRVIQYKKKFLGFIPYTSIECKQCESKWKFYADDDQYKLNTEKEYKYDECSFTGQEWEYIAKRGMSHRDELLYNLALGNFKNLPPVIINNHCLEPKELAYLCESSVLNEPRAVRTFSGGSRGISMPTGIKGVRFRVGGFSGQAESHHEMRAIDNGKIILTNQRLIFNGNMRTVVTQLGKITNIIAFTDAFQINKENKQKPEVYSVQDGEIWANTLTGLMRTIKCKKQ